MRSTTILILTIAMGLIACKTNQVPTATVQPYQVKDPSVLTQRADSLFFAAQRSKMLGDYRTAITQYSDYLKLDRYNPTVYYELARLLVEIKNPVVALSFARVAVKMEPENRWFQNTLADAYVLNEMYDSAAVVFDYLSKNYENNEDYLFNKAIFLAQANKPREAIAVYDTLEKKVGVVEEIIMQKQKLYLRVNDVGNATKEIKKLIDSNPLELRYYILLAEVYEANNYHTEAREYYNMVLDRDAYNPRALIALAKMAEREGKHYLFWDYLQCAFLSPDYNIDEKVAYVYPYLQMGTQDTVKLHEGILLAELVARTHPGEAKAYALLGDIYTQAAMDENAIAAYNHAVALDSTKFPVWYQLMYLYSKKDNPDSLLLTSSQVMKLFPSEFMGYYFNGLANYFKQDYGTAAQVLNRSVGLSNVESRLKADVYSLLGDIYHATGQNVKSDSCYELVLNIRPRDHLVMNNYSYYLSLRGENLEKAAKLSRQSLELQPDSPVYQDTYAWILFRQGKFSEARTWIEKALLHPDAQQDPDVLEHYGDILYNLKEVEKAVEYWQLAKSKGANSQGLARKIAEKRYIHPSTFLGKE
ncbi:hypothetical protein COR50_02970 [Chitinophaga caeni]|uniref:Uncharacterized protein n=1 Tax=Chitinophaga caeni TaxID=2029983 RepID=A0A291QQL2_9BACT|nr:tetratricopeptide repeat protein [Chitinophaga caeni]ATL46211.1 hypothetical protein COR50_02970 [Chitinophaga caeni]